MTVTNRKMFKRDARDKVRQMGGIMASSEPLIQEVARFQPGGSVFSPRAGDQMSLGLGSATLGGVGGKATEGTQMTGSTLRNLLNAPNAREIEQRLLSNFEADVNRQKLNNILEKADILGLRSDKNIANFSDVFNFVQEVNPNFKFTTDMFNKLYGEDADASTRGEFLTRVLSGVGLAVPAVVDVGKGISDFLSGYPTNTIKKFLMGSKVEDGLSVPEGVDATQLALELSKRGVSDQEIKDISGFDIKALTAMAAKSAKGLAGLALEAPGITVKDPEGLMASERAGQPPSSMTIADARAAENKGIRAAEDALMQSRNIVDPQTSLGTDIQAVLRGVEEARVRQGDPLPRNQAEFEKIGADPDVEQAAKIQQAMNEAAKVEGDPLTEAQATEEKREAFPDPLTAEQKADLDRKVKELEAEAEKETDEAINTGDFSKVKDSYANLGRTYSDSKNPVDNPRLRRLIKEFTDNAPKYEGLDSGLALAKIGFMMAAGESPNAIVNIANALNKGADMFLEDDKKRKEFKRQVDFAGLQYGIGEISKLRAEGRAAAREGRKPLFFVADGPIEVDGVKYKDGDTVKLTMGYLLNNPLPKNLQHLEMAKASIKAEEAIKKASLTAASKNLMDTKEYGEIVDEITEAGVKFRSSNYLRNVLEANLVRTAEGKITGFKPAFNSLIDSAFSAVGIDTPSKFTDKKKYDAQMADVANNLLEEILGESGKTISDNDRKILYNLVGLKTGVFGNVFDNKEVIGGKIQNVMNKLDEQEQRSLNIFRSRLESTPGRTLGDDSLVYNKIQQYIPDVAKTQLMQGKITSPFNLVLGDDGVFRRAN